MDKLGAWIFSYLLALHWMVWGKGVGGTSHTDLIKNFQIVMFCYLKVFFKNSVLYDNLRTSSTENGTFLSL